MNRQYTVHAVVPQSVPTEVTLPGGSVVTANVPSTVVHLAPVDSPNENGVIRLILDQGNAEQLALFASGATINVKFEGV